jgi:AraC family transcriptional regulator, positive regulator of tynA and feaB
MHGLVTSAGDYAASNEALSRICGAYRISCDRWWEFRGSMVTREVGSLECADIRFSDGLVIRDRGDARYLGDHYFLVFQAGGRARMRQRGNDAALEPGDCTIIDSRFPSVFEVGPDFHQYSFHFPAELIHDRFGRRGLPLAKVICGGRGAGAVLSDLLASFIRNAAALEGVDLTALALQTLAAAVGEEGGLCVGGGEAHGTPALREMVQYIDAHVHEPDLTPACIAKHFNTSLRRLYRLAAVAGCSPAALIWRRRLEQARKMLASGHSRVPILEIALSCGFKDGAHFSRAYRKAYGHPPKVARSSAEFAVPV